MIAGIIGLVVNPVACQIMINLGVGPLSLSFAYSFANLCQMVILAVIYCRQKELAPYGIVKFLIKAAVCVIFMGAVTFSFDMFLPAQGGKLIQLGIISVKGVTAIFLYFALAVLFHMDEATVWIDKFKSKLFKKKVKKSTT